MANDPEGQGSGRTTIKQSGHRLIPQLGTSPPQIVSSPEPITGQSQLDPEALSYVREEAAVMNARVRWYLEQQEKLESLGLFSAGTIWAFLLSRPYSHALSYIAWLPVILTFVLFLKSLLFTEALKEALEYIEKVESLSHLPPELGWAHHFRLHGKRIKRRWRKAFWLLLLAGTVATALFMPLQALLATSP